MMMINGDSDHKNDNNNTNDDSNNYGNNSFLNNKKGYFIKTDVIMKQYAIAK